MEGHADGAMRSSASLRDVAAVAQAVEECEARLAEAQLHDGDSGTGTGTGGADEPPAPAPLPRRSSCRAPHARRVAPDPAAASLLKTSAPFASGDFISGAEHENDCAEVVIVCEPDLHNNLMGALHPAGSLYERPVNMSKCTAQHAAFRGALRAHGVRCLTVREVLLYDTDASVRARCELEDLAAARLTYELDTGCSARLLSEQDLFFVGHEYKASVLEAMSAEQLVDVVLCGPTVHVMPSFRDTGFTARYAFEPLTNVQFTRDQAVTTARGLVLARLRSPQRQREVELLAFCFAKLGLPVVGAIAAPGFLEGGDFFAAGKRLAFVGIGLRSNLEAAQQLMEGDLLGTRRVALVRDDFERDQARMHLDCVFNIAGDDVCLLAEDCMGDGAPLRRTVDEYERVEEAAAPPAGADAEAAGDASSAAAAQPASPRRARYVLRRSGVEFGAFLRSEGYHVVPVSREHSLAYGCNILNLGDSNVLCCHPETARQLVRCPAFHGRVQLVEFADVTSMYGALHCSSQVVRRTPVA